MSEPTPSWYSVRCVFEWRGPGRQKGHVYEERITLWWASGFEEAIGKAEAEALDYVADSDPAQGPFQYLSFAQAYRMSEWDQLGEGIEVFSMLRESNRKPSDYLTRFFDTGTENNGSAT